MTYSNLASSMICEWNLHTFAHILSNPTSIMWKADLHLFRFPTLQNTDQLDRISNCLTLWIFIVFLESIRPHLKQWNFLVMTLSPIIESKWQVRTVWNSNLNWTELPDSSKFSSIRTTLIKRNIYFSYNYSSLLLDVCIMCIEIKLVFHILLNKIPYEIWD